MVGIYEMGSASGGLGGERGEGLGDSIPGCLVRLPRCRCGGGHDASLVGLETCPDLPYHIYLVITSDICVGRGLSLTRGRIPLAARRHKRDPSLRSLPASGQAG